MADPNGAVEVLIALSIVGLVIVSFSLTEWWD